MSAFFDNAITDAGRFLWQEMQAGGVFIPTKLVVGSGYIPAGKTTRTMTAVAEPIKTIVLNKQSKMPNGDFIIGGVFDNKDIATQFYYRELALFARVEKEDGTFTDETLYSYGNAGDSAEIIPAYSTDTSIERQLDIITYIGNDAVVKLEITSGMSVSKTEFDNAIEELEADNQSIRDDMEAANSILFDRVVVVENQFTQVIPPIVSDIAAIYVRLGDHDERITELETAKVGFTADITGLRAEDARIENLMKENSSKIDALWGALLTDITTNPATVNFDDLTGITLTGGVWNKPLQRLEV